MIKLGKGGVDDAEDAEVILHELGHAIQDSQQVPFGFGGSLEAGSIGEGFADYWAVTVSNVIAPDARRAVRRRLGLGLLHVDDAALPAADRPEPALPGRSESARCTPTAGSGRARSGTSATRSATSRPTRSSSRVTSARRSRRCRSSRRARRSRAAALRHAEANAVRAAFQARGSSRELTWRRRLRAPPPPYQPRVSSSCSGAIEADEMPTIASPRPAETRASTSASL